MSDQKIDKRIVSLDFIRGFTLILVVFLHASIYNFDNIHKIDFENPPIIVVLMSFMALWGGIFIIYSTALNSLMLARRSVDGIKVSYFRHLFTASIIYIFIHYILIIFLGRWSIDFVNNRPDMTAVAFYLRGSIDLLPGIEKYFEGSSLSTIAFNLFFSSVLIYLLFKNNGVKKEIRNFTFLGIAGLFIITLSFLRIPLYELLSNSVYTKNYLASLFFSFFIANPYPIIPYLAYGLFGVLFGLILFNKNYKYILRALIPLGIVFVVIGLFGMSRFEKSISSPDYFWYFKTHLELGVFILMFSFIILLSQKVNLKIPFILWFSRISLTIYLLETTLSEIIRKISLNIFPGWNLTINGCLVFGAINVFIWLIILFIWKHYNFKYSFEYFWVLLFKKLGKNSTKLSD